jgi:chemotaxis protein MotB
MLVRPISNLESLLSDRPVAHDDGAIAPFIDVFVLMLSFLGVVFLLNHFKLVELPAESQQGSLVNGPSEVDDVLDLRFIDGPSLEVNMAFKSGAEIESVINQLELGQQVSITQDIEFTALDIQSRILFNNDLAKLSRSGEALLEKLLLVLKVSEGLIFIEGHTDNQLILTDAYPSNWELASARALVVKQFLISAGMPASRLKDISYGETKPVAPNNTAANRRKNRRVSLLIQKPRQ